MRPRRDPKDLFTADPSKMSSSQRAEYIYLLQNYLTSGPDSDHIRTRISELDWVEGREKVQELRRIMS